MLILSTNLIFLAISLARALNWTWSSISYPFIFVTCFSGRCHPPDLSASESKSLALDTIERYSFTALYGDVVNGVARC